MNNKMRLHHIALNIQRKEELTDFYQNILEFQPEYQFDLNKDIATKIFNISEQPRVFLYKKEEIYFELFVYEGSTLPAFAHLCMQITDRETIVKKCEEAGYPVIRIKRSDKPDLLFIKDKTGNIFELKNDE